MRWSQVSIFQLACSWIANCSNQFFFLSWCLLVAGAWPKTEQHGILVRQWSFALCNKYQLPFQSAQKVVMHTISSPSLARGSVRQSAHSYPLQICWRFESQIRGNYCNCVLYVRGENAARWCRFAKSINFNWESSTVCTTRGVCRALRHGQCAMILENAMDIFLMLTESF